MELQIRKAKDCALCLEWCTEDRIGGVSIKCRTRASLLISFLAAFLASFLHSPHYCTHATFTCPSSWSFMSHSAWSFIAWASLNCHDSSDEGELQDTMPLCFLSLNLLILHGRSIKSISTAVYCQHFCTQPPLPVSPRSCTPPHPSHNNTHWIHA